MRPGIEMVSIKKNRKSLRNCYMMNYIQHDDDSFIHTTQKLKGHTVTLMVLGCSSQVTLKDTNFLLLFLCVQMCALTISLMCCFQHISMFNSPKFSCPFYLYPYLAFKDGWTVWKLGKYVRNDHYCYCYYVLLLYYIYLFYLLLLLYIIYCIHILFVQWNSLQH